MEAEIEILKIGFDMFVKIFNNFGGWYFVLVNLIFSAIVFRITHNNTTKNF